MILDTDDTDFTDWHGKSFETSVFFRVIRVQKVLITAIPREPRNHRLCTVGLFDPCALHTMDTHFAHYGIRLYNMSDQFPIDKSAGDLNGSTLAHTADRRFGSRSS